MQFRLLLIVLIHFWFSVPVRADIILDDTLGRGSPLSLSGPKFTIGADLGQQHGGNLFHSFSQFDIHLGESATFSGPDTINNVISRVTGGAPSEINGLLRSTIPNADFYFMNPAGILFGEHAKLDVPGAFFMSTADYLRLDDGGQFHATHPKNSLLTVAPPAAFGFLTANNAAIDVQSSKLTVPDTQTLSVIAGDINLNNGILQAPEGRIHLASIASAGEVNVVPETAVLDSFAKLGKIELSQSTLGNDTDNFDNFNGARDIYIRGGQFWVNDSFINAKVKNRTGQAGEIVISSREAVELQNKAIISANSFNATDAADITINTHRLNMQGNTTKLTSDTQMGGAAGVITITAKHIAIADEASINSNTEKQGGPSGHIRLEADTIQMTGKTQITATSDRTVQSAGQIIIEADQLQMADDATLNTIAFAEATGDGGEIRIKANQLSMTDRAWIISSSFNSGQSGPINIQADTLILAGESAIVATTFSQGKGGHVTLHVRDTLAVTEAAVVASGTEGTGSGGTVVLVLPADKLTIAEAANINSASEAKNVVTTEIASILKLAKQLGGHVEGNILTGGGEPGRVYIQADQLSINNTTMPSLATELQFKNCVDDPTTKKSSLKIKRREGLFEAFNN